MPSPGAYVPQFFYLQATVAGASKVLNGIFGTVSITNQGANPCWINLTAVPPAAAAFANDRKRVGVNETVNLNNVQVSDVSAISLGGNTDLEITCTQEVGQMVSQG